MRGRQHNTRWQRVLALAAVVAMAATAGCGKGTERRQISAAVVDGKPGFTPASLSVHTGDKVVLVVRNTTDKTHGFSIEGYGVSKVVSTSQPLRVRFTASKAGVFKIFCQLHPTHQTATLRVE
jgi:nitrosocyanin